MSDARTAPATVRWIAFAFPGARDAILLREDRGELVSRTPEWTADGDRKPAAYVRGAQPVIRVVLSRPGGAGSRRRAALGTNPRCTLYATGEGGPGIAARKIRLRFDARGLTSPIALRLARPFRNRSGRCSLRWSWRLRVAEREYVLGTSSHEIFLTARPILKPATWLGHKRAARLERQGRGGRWAYARLVEWTCQWTAGLADEKAIVTAIMRNLPRSELKYAVRVADDVGAMLVAGGGYCNAWARMFRAMAACQGVRVGRRGFTVDWRDRPGPCPETWRELLFRKGGINRAVPASRPRAFRDASLRLDARPAVARVTDRRYSFLGVLNGFGDGHVINVLTYRGSQYLCDPCFLLGPIRLDRPLPRPNANVGRDVADLGNFHRDYLSKAVDAVVGSLPWGPSGVRSSGLTVPITMLNTRGSLTFLWGV